MKTAAFLVLLLALLALSCSSLGFDGQVLLPGEATASAVATTFQPAPAATPDWAGTEAVERAVRLTLTALAPAPTGTPPPSPTTEPTPTPLPTETPSPTATLLPTDTARPVPTTAGVASLNLALNQSTRASASFQHLPDRAVDGNSATAWGAGDSPPQWIEIDLGAAATVTRVRLLVTQSPYGDTVHRLLVRNAQGEFTEAYRFEQYTYTGQWLIFTPEQPLQAVQAVRVETLSGPSWVGWIEIEVLGQR